MHLTYNYLGAHFGGAESIHAQEAMNQLGIKYQHATPQSMGDCFWFWNCLNIPDELPAWIYELEVKAMDYIGCGLNESQAMHIEMFEDK